MAAFVNAAQASDYSGGTSASPATPATSLSTGNFIWAALGFFNGGGGFINPNSVTDTAGNTYHFAVKKLNSNNGSQVHAYYAFNTTGNASNVVTFNMPSAVKFWGVNSDQWSGIATVSDPLDVTAVGEGASPNVETGLYTTTSADEVMFCSARSENIGQSWSGGLTATLRTQDASGILGTEDDHYTSIMPGVFSRMVASSTPNATILTATFRTTGQTPDVSWVQTRYHYEYRY